ncbi:MAG: hypothetical protein HY882_02475 [Deltaproteobacteria bacterium]|nr:hypothetical protein [Deltaproteobacteria bacterium]
MVNALTKKKIIEVLTESAVQRFGEERAKFLTPAIQDIAGSLAFIAEHAVELEEEPAFFL